MKPGKTASNGCATFTGLSTVRSYYVLAQAVLGIPATGMQLWSGYTPHTTGTGPGTVHIGTGVVYFRGYI